MSIYLGETPLASRATTDQTYDATSTNAQSGTAVAGLLEAIYPVGSVYIGTQSTCPMSTVMSGTTWTLVSSGRVLQGADNDHAAGTTIAAGLPNITGEMTWAGGGGVCGFNTGSGSATGALKFGTTNLGHYSSGSSGNGYSIKIDASQSNSIYGNSTSVQSPAYVVNIWERTA